jgi:hypothetical protein
MKCKLCGTSKKRVRVAPVVGDLLCEQCWGDVQTDMRRKGVTSKEDNDNYVQFQYPRLLRG